MTNEAKSQGQLLVYRAPGGRGYIWRDPVPGCPVGGDYIAARGGRTLRTCRLADAKSFADGLEPVS